MFYGLGYYFIPGDFKSHISLHSIFLVKCAADMKLKGLQTEGNMLRIIPLASFWLTEGFITGNLSFYLHKSRPTIFFYFVGVFASCKLVLNSGYFHSVILIY